MESDQFFPEFWPANKLIGILEGVLVKAEDIIGQLKNAQIESLEAPKITGQLTDVQIEEISAAKIAGQLTDAQIESLSAAKIAGQIVDSQIKELTAGKIKGLLSNSQIEAIEATKITGQLSSAQIKELEAAKIAGKISHSQIAAEAITAENIAALTITAGQIAVGAIKAEKIETGAVIAAKIAAGAVIAEKIAAEAIEASKIAALAVTTAKLAVGAVTAEKIAANAVTAEKILAESITAVKIAAGAISAEKIAVGAVTAEKISVSKLSAISADLGTVTAGLIQGVVIKSLEEGTEITKEGIKLLISTIEAPATDRTILWTSAGVKAARMYARKNGEEVQTWIESLPLKAGNKNPAIEIAGSNSGSAIDVYSDRVGGIARRLIDNEGKADFLQLLVTGKLKVTFKTVTYTWKAGTGASEVLATVHGLAEVPVFAYAVGLFGAGGALHTMRITERTKTEIKTQMNRNEAVAAETKLEFLMIIIG